MNDTSKFIIPIFLGSGLFSGVIVALLSYYLTRKKYNQEIDNLKIVNKKLELEFEILKKTQENSASEITASFDYYQSFSTKETIVYQSLGSDMGFDFKSKSGHSYSTEMGVEIVSKERGEGAVNFENGVINIERTNKEGRYELWLESYFVNSKHQDMLKKDIISGTKKKYKLNFSAKVVNGEHQLLFTFKGLEKGTILARTEKVIKNISWTDFTIYFVVDPNENFRLRIDDYNMVNLPSSIQLKNFLLVENTN